MDLLLNWASTNAWALFAILALIIFGKRIYNDLLLTPLAGGNGKVQMDELAKFVILAVFVYSSVVEATRKTEHHVFTDTYFFSLLLTVCAIAAIKPLFANIGIFRGDKKDTNDQPPQ